jgi:hypothetical protein
MRNAAPRAAWLPIALAPEDCDLEIGQLRLAGIEAFCFPCRRKAGIWYNAWTDEAVLVHPSHWRAWRQSI